MQYESRSNSWRRRVGVGLVAIALFVAACSGDDDEPEDDGTATAEPGEATTTTIDPSLIAPLTGVVGEDSVPERSALVIKIDNAEVARPHAGLRDADIVIEERVEGDQTRLMAVFHSTIPERVGPVRSTRSTDFDLIPMFGRPVYASSGGNTGVMSKLAEVGTFDVGHNRGGDGFERDGDRPAPHNLFASPETLIARAGEDADQPPDQLFEYRRDGDELPDSAEEASSVGLSFDKVEAVDFAWDADDEVWLRSQRGSEHVDVDGEQLAPVNVVVLQIEYTFTEVIGTSNPHGVTTGEGTAMVFTDGHVIEGTWSRPTPEDPFELLDEDGEEIELTPGQTFIELPAKTDPVTVG